jgi:lathosterol oxidase
MATTTQENVCVNSPTQDEGKPEKSQKKRRKIWNYQPDQPLEYSPLFKWPLSFIKISDFIRVSYFSLSIKMFVLGLALLSNTFLAPSYETTHSISTSWVLGIFVRNLALMMVIAGSLHLYFYTFAKQGLELKFDSRSMAKDSGTFKFRNQVWDNMYYSLVYGVTFWTIFEVALLWSLKNEYMTLSTWSDGPIWFALAILLIPLWHSFHFYWVHRLLHWEPLYKMVHSLHHKNVNVGPWSGMSMHPIESFFYLTSVLIHFAVPTSPLHIVFHLMFLIFNAVISHSGFEALLMINKSTIKMGRFYHQLHHKFFTCNYGTAEMPWDAWFGSFHDGTPEAHERIFGKRK